MILCKPEPEITAIPPLYQVRVCWEYSEMSKSSNSSCHRLAKQDDGLWNCL